MQTRSHAKKVSLNLSSLITATNNSDDHSKADLLFDYLVENSWFLSFHPKFSRVTWHKLVELYYVENYKRARLYASVLYPEKKFPDIPKTESVSKKQIKYLRAGYWSRFHPLYESFLQEIFPCTYLVPSDDPQSVAFDLHAFFFRTLFFPPEKGTLFIPGQPGDCHNNCATLFYRDKLESVYHGYALSDDGLWRYHSWGFDKDQRLVETTVPRLAYFGCTFLPQNKN